MGKGKGKMKAANSGGPKDRHLRDTSKKNTRAMVGKVPAALYAEAKARVPVQSTEYKVSYMIQTNEAFQEKKLEIQHTTEPDPPRGFKFVPISCFAMVDACKAISRKQGAVILMVSGSSREESMELSHQTNRDGYHVQNSVWHEAAKDLPTSKLVHDPASDTIPEDQKTYSRQVSKVIMALFPNIGNTDREAIIMHSFNLNKRNGEPNKRNGEQVRIGVNPELPLVKRVQGAVLAHIRHAHTKYDDLLKIYNWGSAREIVQHECLKKLVQWRSDEESGRDRNELTFREFIELNDDDGATDAALANDPVPTQAQAHTSGMYSQSHNPHPAHTPANGGAPGGLLYSASFPQAPAQPEYAPRQESSHRTTYPRSQPLVYPEYSSSAYPNPPLNYPTHFDEYSGQQVPKKNQNGFKRYQQARDDTMLRDREEHNKYGPAPVSDGAQPLYRAQGDYRQAASYGQHSEASMPVAHRQYTPLPHPVEDMLVASVEHTSPNNAGPSTNRYDETRGNIRHSPFYVPQQRPAESSSFPHVPAQVQQRPAEPSNYYHQSAQVTSHQTDHPWRPVAGASPPGDEPCSEYKWTSHGFYERKKALPVFAPAWPVQSRPHGPPPPRADEWDARRQQSLREAQNGGFRERVERHDSRGHVY